MQNQSAMMVHYNWEQIDKDEIPSIYTNLRPNWWTTNKIRDLRWNHSSLSK